MEGNLFKRIQVALCKSRTVRLFRNNTGKAWQGRQQWDGRTKLILHNPRPLTAGLVVGGSDGIGWVSQIVTPDMVGKPVAIFLAIEVKTDGVRTTAAQAAFIRAVRAAGGRAGIAKTVPEAVAIATQLEI